MKKCSTCKKLFYYDNFHKCKKSKDGYKSICKFCRKEESNSIRLSPKILVEKKFCNSCNMEKSSIDFPKDISKKDGLYTKCKKCCIEKTKNFYKKHIGYKASQDKKYYKNNKKSIIDRQNKKESIRRKVDIFFKLRKQLSKTIRLKLKNFGSNKNGLSILKYLPYTIQELKQHLESLFEPWMNWSNYGVYKVDEWDNNNQSTWKWNIDHIIPQSDLPYTSMEDDNFKKCWSLENLRPYSAKQNLLDRNRKK